MMEWFIPLEYDRFQYTVALQAKQILRLIVTDFALGGGCPTGQAPILNLPLKERIMHRQLRRHIIAKRPTAKQISAEIGKVDYFANGFKALYIPDAHLEPFRQLIKDPSGDTLIKGPKSAFVGCSAVPRMHTRRQQQTDLRPSLYHKPMG